MDKPKLQAIPGQRDELERNLADALFTIHAEGVNEMIEALMPRRRLKPISSAQNEQSVPHQSDVKQV